MNPESIVLITWLMGCASAWISQRITGLSFTVCFWYWFGWGVGIPAAAWMGSIDMLPAITPLAASLIFRLHCGAFIGFFLGSIVYRSSARRSHPPMLIRKENDLVVVGHITNVTIILAFLASLGQLYYRTSVMGVDVTDLAVVRESYVESQGSIGQRIIFQILIVTAWIPALFALEDVRDGVIRTRRLAIFLAAAGLGGLTTGGRGWIIAPLVTYTISLFCALDGRGAWKRAIHSGWRLRYLGVLASSLFVIVLVFRSYERGSLTQAIAEERIKPWSESSLSVLPIITYFGIPISAIDPYAQIAETWSPTKGSMSLGWISKQLYRVGVYDRNYDEEYLILARQIVRSNYDDRLASTHATIVPRLVGDFGVVGVAPAMCVLAFATTCLGIALRNRGFLLHLIAISCLQFGGFWLFQDFLLFAGSSILGVFWAAAAYFVLRLSSGNKLFYSKGQKLRRNGRQVLAPSSIR